MNTIVSNIKISNQMIVPTEQIIDKILVENNNNLTDKNLDKSKKYDYFCNFDNKRLECENCDRLILKTLLDHELCEMCSIKSKRKKQILKKKLKILIV